MSIVRAENQSYRTVRISICGKKPVRAGYVPRLTTKSHRARFWQLRADNDSLSCVRFPNRYNFAWNTAAEASPDCLTRLPMSAHSPIILRNRPVHPKLQPAKTTLSVPRVQASDERP